MNTAEILNFPIADMGIQEQRVADTDDGYTRLANELYEELIGSNLTKNQAKVAHAYCRKTYGFNKKMDRIADTQIAQLTRLPRQKVNAAKKELISMRVLVEEGDLIGPNKNLHEWILPEAKKGPSCHHSSDRKCPHDSDSHHGSDTVPTIVTKSVTTVVTAVSPKQGHTKDTNTKDNKDNSNKPPKSPRAGSFDAASVQLPDWLSAVTWSSWVEYRRDLKKPIKSQQTVTQAINLLDRCRLNGYAPEEIINRSIANGWQGLFEPDGQAKRSRDACQEDPHWNSPEAWRDFL
ncbi:TPA: replication protein [Klebsiella michiganensis]|uniref:replication protein n=1 Tax=Klebsiella michiganensis TaxID=1134687 RepID=UPI001E497F50|nr:replication protein [Klebsiella michiganensis]MCD6621023.1 replication protein [Klebsiella michiganensis]MDU4157462.1 replication protein [Klebsiella michiganensis]